MRINHNLCALNTYNRYSKNTSASKKSMEKLSSGLRVNRAADDAAGLSVSEKMRSQIRGLEQAKRNAQDGISFLQTAEGSLSEVSDMLIRCKELAGQAGMGEFNMPKNTGIYTLTDLENIGNELESLSHAMSDIIYATKFNNIDVFNTGAAISVGEDGSQTVTIEPMKHSDLDVILTNLINIPFDNLPNGDMSHTLINMAIDEVSSQRAVYGALQNQLEHITNNMDTTAENLQAAESRIRDVDMAKEMSEYTKNNILVQAAQAMLSQANAQPQSVLQLLQS